MAVTVYTTPTCGFCHQVKSYLARKGVPYAEKDVSRDRSAADEMVQRSGQMGVPVIEVDGQIVVGFNMQALEQLLSRQTARPSLGLKVADAAHMARKQGGGPTSGAYVGAVGPGSPGQRAGLQPGDVIVAIDERTISSADDVSRAMSNLARGRSVDIVYLRDGRNLEGQAAL